VIQRLIIFAVQLYRWTLSPAKRLLFGASAGCRFYPSCSQYAVEAVQLHGAGAGSVLAVRRLCRCHPWGGCGLDLVPPVDRPQSSEALS